MARVSVTHGIGDLKRDLTGIATGWARKVAPVVRRSIREGNAIARANSRASSGPHGKNYHKRLTAEMTGPLSGEYGPHGTVAENAVGAGWRNGPQNTDLPRSADVIGPRFAHRVGDAVGELFWT